MSFTGKELGSGAFGMVVQATAYGINKPGVSQQVAVKMLKGQCLFCASMFHPVRYRDCFNVWSAFQTCRKTPLCGEGGSHVGAEDAHSHRSPQQHCEPAWRVHRLGYAYHY